MDKIVISALMGESSILVKYFIHNFIALGLLYSSFVVVKGVLLKLTVMK